MKHKFLIILAATLVCCMQTNANPIKRFSSYNMQRGMEAFHNEQYADALEYAEKEIRDNPQNGYAWQMIAGIYTKAEQYGDALAAASAAIKYLPKGDTEFVGVTYRLRSRIYANLEDTTAAIRDLTQAIRICPSNYDLYDDRGELYFQQQKYALSDADYNMLLQSDDSENIRDALMGLARNRLRQGNTDEALKIYNRVIQLHNDDAKAYAWRAETYLEHKKYNDAADDIITALKLNADLKAHYLMCSMQSEQAFVIMRMKLKKEQNASPNSGLWLYFEGQLCENHKQYHDAIDAYKKALEADASVSIEDDIADCYKSLGDYDMAVRYYNKSIENDSTDIRTRLNCMGAYGESGNRTKAIEMATALIEQTPDASFLYRIRGWWEMLEKLYDTAIDDLTMAIVLEPKDAESYSNRGRCYMKTGRTDLARDDFEEVLKLSDINNENRCGALAYLGRKKEARDCTRTLADDDGEPKDSAGYYYSAACVYSILNEKALALQSIERSLQLGFHRFAHIDADMDLDNIRETQEFGNMVETYRQKHLQSLQTTDSPASKPEEQRVVEVPFSKANGVTKVECTINNLPLNFVFDTGASDVTLSQVEATFMLKNGYLNEKDVVGAQYYQTADGNISEGTIVNLRRISFGGLELNNVRASVVKSQNAPLLLGQSVLQRLGKIEIDNNRKVLKITTKTE